MKFQYLNENPLILTGAGRVRILATLTRLWPGVCARAPEMAPRMGSTELRRRPRLRSDRKDADGRTQGSALSRGV